MGVKLQQQTKMAEGEYFDFYSGNFNFAVKFDGFNLKKTQFHQDIELSDYFCNDLKMFDCTRNREYVKKVLVLRCFFLTNFKIKFL